MSVTTGLETTIANFFWRDNATVPRISGASYSYIGLCSSSPGESGTTTTEITTIDSRKQLTNTTWTSPSNNSVTYNAQVSWTATATEAATHWLLSTASGVNSNHTFYAAFPSTLHFVSGNTPRFRLGSLKVNVSGLFSYNEGSILLGNLLRGSSTANTTTTYFGLSTTAPNPDGTNVTEPSGGSYARVNHPMNSSYWGSPSGSSPTSVANSAAVTFPEATGGWGTVSHWVAYNQSTGGTLVYYGALDASKLITTGLQPRFAIGNLVFTID